MKKLFFSVFDSKALVYSNPFLSINTGTAIRDFSAAVNTPGNDLNKYPLDFSLVQVGEFDDETGALIPCMHVNLGTAQQYLSLE